MYILGWALIGGYLGMTAGAAVIYTINYKEVKEEEIERRSADFAIYPLLLAARDREYLKQLRRNRDEEAKLMANVEGWKVGTWYGESIYKTAPKDGLVEPSFFDFYVHANPKDRKKREDLTMWS